ncbi:ABC transporter permease [Tellurirhabdus bombi]|uniref:ABC transporter permease n=1 Tax=Tellurirhabdus bombi TaxID=2907205 RepID=UPI001F2FA483|nr:ABC transporter permease [Tellurirhabdus bombi]
MIQNYLKIAWRNLIKHPTTTGIHLLGLTLGLTTCLLIVLFIQNEWSFDRHHQQGERIYRVNTINTTGDDVEKTGVTPYPLGAALRQDFPDWSKIVSVHTEEDAPVFISSDKILREKKVLFAEPSYLDVFGIEMVAGNGRATLTQPNQVILSESTARKFFGNASAIGKTIRLGTTSTMQVTGIMRDMPTQSSLGAGMLVSYASLKKYFQMDIDQWGLESGGSVFALLPEGNSPDQYAGRLRQAIQKYFSKEDAETREFVLQPLHDIHFNSDFKGTRFEPAIAPTYLYVFGAVGLFVLLIACVNFINMSTARAMTRAKEVGVRKVIGATRSQLVGQFLSEAFWLAGISALLALVLTHQLLPLVNEFMQKQIHFQWVQVGILMLTLALLTSVAAGLYPAAFMARFKPIRALKTGGEQGRGSQTWLRQGLVVFQFSISLILAVGVVVLYQQMNYFRQKDLGFKREALVVVSLPEPKNLSVLNQSLREIPGVEKVSFALGAPTSQNNFGTTMRPDPSNPNKKIPIALKLADADYLKTYGLKLLAGRFFEHRDTLSIASTVPEEKQKYAFVVNERTVKALGFSKPEQVLGRKIRVEVNDIDAEIIGVVKDFHTSSLRDPIGPMVMMNFPNFYYTVGLKLKTNDYATTLAAVERSWQRVFPNSLFEAKFLDNTLQELYDNEQRQFTLLRISAGLALVICCLGLWGLATFTIERRTKEIGVRKVLGASTTGIVVLISRDFLKLVLVAFIVASPVAWYLMDSWLASFSYRISIEWWVFALVGVVALGIAFLTVSFQSIKAAFMNPVKSLKTE